MAAPLKIHLKTGFYVSTLYVLTRLVLTLKSKKDNAYIIAKVIDGLIMV